MPFFSGTGSRTETVVQPYIQAVSDFLRDLPTKPDAVDLGCGDFYVGSRLRSLCGRYAACDVVAPMIEHHRSMYASLDVDFRCVDITSDALPLGEVVFVRQVLQHLSNRQITAFVTRLRAAGYRYLVLTEHLPESNSFVPNRDKTTGADIRLEKTSGVVLTAPPFNLPVVDRRSICRVKEFGGIIETIVYTLPTL